jgi:hypothetical protein
LAPDDPLYRFPGRISNDGDHRKKQPAKLAMAITTVRNQAPTLSPCVAGVTMEPGSMDDLFRPALGSDTLVPPVLLVKGLGTLLMMVLSKTSRAAICCPGPFDPSQVAFLVHSSPQLLGKKVPLHCFMAAVAEDRSTGVIFGSVKGANCVVKAIHRER